MKHVNRMKEGALIPSRSAPAPAHGRPRKTKRYFAIGWFFIFASFGGLTAWSVFAPFQGAVSTSGLIVVSENQQAVQHLTGGIVESIEAEDGTIVRRGDILVRLDDTVLRANLAAIETRLISLIAVEERLISERDGRSELGANNQSALTDFGERYANQLSIQNELFLTRQENRTSEISILRKKKSQLRSSIIGMNQEASSKAEQIELLEDEIETYSHLFEKKLVAKPRLLATEREFHKIGGERQSLIADIETAELQIQETDLEITRLTDGFLEDVQAELVGVQTELGELSEQRVAALEELRRATITAPASGQVLGSNTHTIGGVIAPGDALMFIVPEESSLIAQVTIQPKDIDKVAFGQVARLRFSAFSMEETPEVEGSVKLVSADAMTDEVTGNPYYEALVEIPKDRLAQEDFALVPGMPVDVFIQTDTRSVISYLLKPLGDAMSKAFRE